MGRSILHVILFYILFTFLIIQPPVFSFRSHSKEHFEGEGDQCSFSNGEQGVCKELKDCPYQLKKYYNSPHLIKVQEICGFDGITETVCCPPEQEYMNTRKLPVQPYVIAGIRAVEKEFPYLAVLAYENKNRSPGDQKYTYICGGSLISPRHVLTAAHCIKNRDKFVPHHVLLGAIDLIKPGDNVQRIEIAGRVSHPQYRPHLVYNDVAVLILKSNAVINSFVKPTRFYGISLQSTRREDKNFQAIGFGLTEEEELSTVLLKTHNLRIVPQDECQRWYSNNFQSTRYGLDDTLICGRDFNTSRNSDTCTGDSGGPLIMTHKFGTKPPVLVGLTAFGNFCGTLAPGVYTAVYPYLNWIDGILRMN